MSTTPTDPTNPASRARLGPSGVWPTSIEPSQPASIEPTRPRVGRSWRRRLAGFVGGSAGQATAEYALVMLAAAGLAGLLLAWATSTDGVARLMNAVLDSLISDAES